jgi:hypothetical protein
VNTTLHDDDITEDEALDDRPTDSGILIAVTGDTTAAPSASYVQRANNEVRLPFMISVTSEQDSSPEQRLRHHVQRAKNEVRLPFMISVTSEQDSSPTVLRIVTGLH